MTSQLRPNIIRDAIILHGRELINVGTERDWGSEGASQKELVEKGVYYLRLAGDNVQSMELERIEGDSFFKALFQSHL